MPLEVALARLPVDGVDANGAHLDDDLIGAGVGLGDVGKLQDGGVAELGVGDCLHDKG